VKLARGLKAKRAENKSYLYTLFAASMKGWEVHTKHGNPTLKPFCANGWDSTVRLLA